MNDILDKINEYKGGLEKLIAKIPGFKGYIALNDRRKSDKLLREMIVREYEVQYQRLSSVQRALISAGELGAVGELENAAIKLRQFIDRVRTASYGYAGLFDAIRIRETELETVYRFDAMLLDKNTEIARAIDNVEASIGTDGQAAAIRNLITHAQEAIVAFNKRSDIMKGIAIQ
jgi:SNF2 family DNA or RNA helicase